MVEEARKWTSEERQQLFDVYFGPSAGICPVCAQEVSMLMSHLGRKITLLLACEGCGNKASVSRILPIQGPLHRTANRITTG